MKFIGLMNVYNAMPVIQLSLPLVAEQLDEVWVFDGSYGDFATDDSLRYSTDGTADYVKSYGKNVNYYFVEYSPTQVAKRQHIIDSLPTGSVGFIIDADELWYGEWEFVKRRILSYIIDDRDATKIFCVDGRDAKTGHNRRWPRVIYKAGLLQYYGNHYTLVTGDGRSLYDMKQLDAPPNFHRLQFLHVRQGYSKSYREQRKVYYSTRKEQGPPDKELVYKTPVPSDVLEQYTKLTKIMPKAAQDDFVLFRMVAADQGMIALRRFVVDKGPDGLKLLQERLDVVAGEQEAS
jgi:hypothetical protein